MVIRLAIIPPERGGRALHGARVTRNPRSPRAPCTVAVRRQQLTKPRGGTPPLRPEAGHPSCPRLHTHACHANRIRLRAVACVISLFSSLCISLIHLSLESSRRSGAAQGEAESIEATEKRIEGFVEIGRDEAPGARVYARFGPDVAVIRRARIRGRTLRTIKGVASFPAHA